MCKTATSSLRASLNDSVNQGVGWNGCDHVYWALGSPEADTGGPSPQMSLSGREDRCRDGPLLLGGDEPVLREPGPCQEESRLLEEIPPPYYLDQRGCKCSYEVTRFSLPQKVVACP